MVYGGKNVLLEQEKIKLRNGRHFVGKKKADYAVCLQNAVNFLVALMYNVFY
jgi:hypothetical protein